MAEMRTVTIYGLRHPQTKEVFYIGQTIDPERRLRDHMRGEWGSQSRNGMMASLWESDLQPEMVILDEVPLCDANTVEAEYIKSHLADGIQLTNVQHTATHNGRHASVYFPEDIWKWLRHEAVDRKISMSDLVVEIAKEHRAKKEGGWFD